MPLVRNYFEELKVVLLENTIWRRKRRRRERRRKVQKRGRKRGRNLERRSSGT